MVQGSQREEGDGRQAILPVIPGTSFICSTYCEQFSVATIAAV